MIAHLLLDQRQKTTLKKIFKIMDSSGDGSLESDELAHGFKKIFDDE
jgi:Ca2+-binding EF-hand superfamily protein